MATWDTEDIQTFVCEVCDKSETLTNGEAYDQGWDYPPFVGVHGVVSARTCGDCGIIDTAWWAVVQGTGLTQLSEKHLATINRILAEVQG